LSKNEKNKPKNLFSFFAARNSILVFQFGPPVKKSGHPLCSVSQTFSNVAPKNQTFSTLDLEKKIKYADLQNQKIKSDPKIISEHLMGI